MTSYALKITVGSLRVTFMSCLDLHDDVYQARFINRATYLLIILLLYIVHNTFTEIYHLQCLESI